MSDTLEFFKARVRIIDTFLPGLDPESAAQGLSNDDFERILGSVRPFLPLRSLKYRAAFSKFLYEGCRRYDRWFVPTPYVVPNDNSRRFARFVSAYSLMEGEQDNCAVFKLHAVRDMVFEKFDALPLADIDPDALKDFRTKASEIRSPISCTKRLEFEHQKNELFAILDGLTDASLRTVFKFRIPYSLHKQKLDIGFVWRDIVMRAQVTPSSWPTEEIFVGAEGGAASTIGASRWQTGTTEITFEQSALIDASIYAPPLHALPTTDVPLQGWPKSFVWAFSIFHDLSWRLRLEHGGQQDWLPAPRDLSDLESFLKTSSNDNLNFIRRASPATFMEIYTPSDAQLKIEFGVLTRLAWHMECRVRAMMYLELGDTNESLFWLNVAVESLILARFAEIGSSIGRPNLAMELGSPKEFWADAEAIVSKQLPEMKGVIEWPTAPIHVSIFGKLKALYRNVKMWTSLDHLLKNYKFISGERNDLFHGKQTGRTTVETVKAAAEALSWIEKNMLPAE